MPLEKVGGASGSVCPSSPSRLLSLPSQDWRTFSNPLMSPASSPFHAHPKQEIVLCLAASHHATNALGLSAQPQKRNGFIPVEPQGSFKADEGHAPPPPSSSSLRPSLTSLVPLSFLLLKLQVHRSSLGTTENRVSWVVAAWNDDS